jgi:phosphoribosylglycinamide formyltransferase-1
MKILPANFVSALKGKLINIHPSLLPDFKGAHAVRDALAAGATKTGVTIHYVDEGVDTGEVIVQAEVAIEAGDTEQILHERIKRVEHELLGSTIEQLAYKQKPVLRVES